MILEGEAIWILSAPQAEKILRETMTTSRNSYVSGGRGLTPDGRRASARVSQSVSHAPAARHSHWSRAWRRASRAWRRSRACGASLVTRLRRSSSLFTPDCQNLPHPPADAVRISQSQSRVGPKRGHGLTDAHCRHHRHAPRPGAVPRILGSQLLWRDDPTPLIGGWSVSDVGVIDDRDAPTTSSVAVNAPVAIPTAPTPSTYWQSTAIE